MEHSEQHGECHRVPLLLSMILDGTPLALAVGGYGIYGPLNTIEFYNPNTNIWTLAAGNLAQVV